MKRLTLLSVALAFLISWILWGTGAIKAEAPLSPGQQTSRPSVEVPSATVASARAQTIAVYTLPPDRYQKARSLSRIRFRFAIIGFLYGLGVLWMVLRWKLGPRYRDWAERAFSRRLFQGLVFAPLMILTIGILELPTGIYANWVSREYGISVQSWGSWSWDLVKSQFVGIVIGTIGVSVLYAVIRASPRRWWLYFWLASLPLTLALFFLQPLVIDPLFHKFEPLAVKAPVRQCPTAC